MNTQRKTAFTCLLTVWLCLLPLSATAQDIMVADAPTITLAESSFLPTYFTQLSELQERLNEQETTAALRHIIVRGETLTMIAKKYGVRVEDIIEANDIKNPNIIQVGQVLTLVTNSSTDKDPTAPVIHKTNTTSRVIASRTAVRTENISDPGFIWPTSGSISSGYGPRWGKFHYGLDITTTYGNPVVAIAGGRVVAAGWLGSYGYMIRIDHQNGWVSVYGHNSKLYVQEGQFVQQGQKIADIGQTGNATGPHVHLETIYNGKYQNPLKYLPAQSSP